MKRFAALCMILLAATLACQALQPDVRPTATRLATESASTSTPEAGEAAYTPTPRPTPRPITCTDDSCLDACLLRINDAVGAQSFSPLPEAYADTQANINMTDYAITNGLIGEPDDLYVPASFRNYQADRAAHLRVWNYVAGLLSPNEMKWINKFNIFTDGPQNVLAWVSEGRDDDRSTWTLGVDLLDSEDPVYLTYTLAHEFGHLVTLNTGQIPQSDFSLGWLQNAKYCATLLSPDGCSNPDSYLNLFYQKFWTGIFEEWRKDVEQVPVNSPEQARNLVRAFYIKHDEQFVREYAATNIYEDMAESFMHFVLDPKPTGDSFVDQKIRFYYDFPELLAFRQQMIQGVCSYTQ